ncbi:MAG: CD225/dispanin family protein [Mangrovibacterium sp.]
MATHFFYTKDGENFGPLSISQLKAEGISPETLVWHAELTEWTPASKVSELKALFVEEDDAQSQPPPPPPKEDSSSEAHPKYIPTYPPKSYLVEAILVTIFCCLPFGIISIVHASRVESRFYAGNYEGSFRASRKARRWVIISLISLVLTFGLSFIINILFFAGALLSFPAADFFV